MDVLVLGRLVLFRDQQGRQMTEADRTQYLAQFQLD
jgi:hypothetical protein